MTVTEFERLIDLHGLDFAVWPTTLAEDALDLMLNSEAAQDLYADRCGREEGAADPVANAALAERIEKSLREQ